MQAVEAIQFLLPGAQILEGHNPVIGNKPRISQNLEEQRVFDGIVKLRRIIFGQDGLAMIGGAIQPLPSEG
jgi:hypothetical protein